MEARDRIANLGLLGAAALVWLLVALIVTTRDPVLEPESGYIGAALIGLAIALTLIPVFWLLAFTRHKRIAYRGDWLRAVRRGAWVGLIVMVLVAMRLQGLLEWPIALFVIALALIAETTLSAER